MQDLRDAVRALRATPLVTAVAVLSLALGIGANTAIFSIVNSLLLRTLPVHDPQRLVLLSSEDSTTSWTNPIWEAIKARTPSFDGAAAYSTTRFDLAQGGEAEFVDGLWASGDFFHVLGVPAMLGRTLTPADDRRGGGPDGPVTVVSYGFWQRRFGGAADAIGRSITLNRVVFTIVGVTPPQFFGPEVGRTFDVVVPLGDEPLVRGAAESYLDARSTWWLSILLRLRPDQSATAAVAALRGVQPQVREATLPSDWRPEWLARYLTSPLTAMAAATGESYLRERYRRPLVAIMVVVGLVLLIACANVANLMLARATARRHELSVRQALGASRWRLARQLLAESGLLAAVGAVGGLAFAVWGSRLLVHQLSTQSRTVFLDLALDWRVLAFTAAAAAGTALLFGTVPALGATRVEPIEALKEQGRGVAGGRSRFATTLVAAQVALSLALVVAAGLFVRTFAALANRDLGFDQGGMLIASLSAQKSSLPADQRPALFERVRQAVAALPGVERAVLSDVTPVAGMTWQWTIELPEGSSVPEQERGAYVNRVSPGWFAAYRTPLLAGRDFDERDTHGSPYVTVVNQAFARRFLGGVNPVGQTVRHPDWPGRPSPTYQIVGLVGDAVYRSVREPIPPTMYLPASQDDDPRPFISLSVRSATGSPALLTRSMARAIGGVDRDLTITFRVLSEQVGASLTQERLVAILSGFFGGLALLLAGLGLYGVTAYAVHRRRPELGIRMALGAAPTGVVRLVLQRVALTIAAGVLAGGLLTWWTTRLTGTLLYGVEPRDPITFGTAALVLMVVGSIAGWLPARRAARIDPVDVLREA